VALPNLVLCRDALPEAVFGAATPARLAHHLRTLLEQPGAAQAQASAAAEFLARVAPPALDAWLGAPAAARPRPSAVAAAAVLRRVGARLAGA
jgi:lipid A disaccharide synthetase